MTITMILKNIKKKEKKMTLMMIKNAYHISGKSECMPSQL
jgi:hypothetical protein